ncbi:MAG: hydantoinase B/oxoprolinase family protein, partial [Sphingomicrobium sp.]
WLRAISEDWSDRLAELEDSARQDLAAQGHVAAQIVLHRRSRLRAPGSDTTIVIDLAPPEAMRATFDKLHRKRFGFVDAAEPVIDTLSVEAVASGAQSEAEETVPGYGAELIKTGKWNAFQRGELAAGQSIDGPVLVLEASSATVVEPGWSAVRADDATLILTRTVPLERGHAIGTEVDPVRLEISNNLFMAIAEEMGVALQSTAVSVSIKERLDFSCALFNAEGELIANAPHIPVHLGSMGESIRTIIEARGKARDGRGIRRGDAYALNDPYRGGTHLPDITVIVPVFYGDEDAPSAFVAARGHHADIGGIAPGSMPPDSQTIADEGVLIDNFLLLDEGHFREAEMRALLGDGAFPARSPDRNISDLRAQIAACARGAESLVAVAKDYGADVVAAYMDHVMANAEEAVRRLIGRLEDGQFEYAMDNGAKVAVSIRVDQANRSAVFDFTGTSAQLPNNFNAPHAIVRAASLYVVRTLIDDVIPMNDGCLRPIQIIVPEGSMLNPTFPAAVVAGNVETSQVITDSLFAATGRLAPSQGTMNNFTFGNARYQYYETIAGGSGAGIDHDGTDAVQTHMTNSRLTDPEILESRLPVRLDRFAIRHGSGGHGAHPGGDGVVRHLTFLEPMRANILANRREVAPRGLAGGGDALPGRNWVERKDGSIEILSASQSADMKPGDRFVIETPGGGAYGEEQA